MHRTSLWAQEVTVQLLTALTSCWSFFLFCQRSCWMLLGCCLGFEHCSSRRQRGSEAREDPGLQELL